MSVNFAACVDWRSKTGPPKEIAMGSDIRMPPGLMFPVTGGRMAVYGLFPRGSAIDEKPLDMNINLVWGGRMLVFGAAMYILGRQPRRLAANHVKETERPVALICCRRIFVRI